MKAVSRAERARRAKARAEGYVLSSLDFILSVVGLTPDRVILALALDERRRPLREWLCELRTLERDYARVEREFSSSPFLRLVKGGKASSEAAARGER